MPSTSKKQANFMRAVAHSPSFAKKVGVPQSVGKDFNMADKKKGKYAAGGDAAKTAAKIDMVNAKMRSKVRGAAGYAKGGSIDGIAKKGKTHTTMVKMAKGGKMKRGKC